MLRVVLDRQGFPLAAGIQAIENRIEDFGHLRSSVESISRARLNCIISPSPSPSLASSCPFARSAGTTSRRISISGLVLDACLNSCAHLLVLPARAAHQDCAGLSRRLATSICSPSSMPGRLCQGPNQKERQASPWGRHGITSTASSSPLL